jgi:hypothetical protein
MAEGFEGRDRLLRRMKTEMEVIGQDGNHIGHVREIRPRDFLLHRPGAISVFVPFEFVDEVSEPGNRVILKVTEGQIAEMDWPSLEEDVSARKPLGGV